MNYGVLRLNHLVHHHNGLCKRLILKGSVRIKSTNSLDRMGEIKRFQQAKNSVIIQHDKELYVKPNLLLRQCEVWGDVNFIGYVVHHNEYKTQYLSLVEYENNSSVANLLNNTNHFSSSSIPVHSRALYLHSTRESESKVLNIKRRLNMSKRAAGFKTEISTLKDRNAAELSDLLIRCNTINEQIKCLYDYNKFSEMDIKLRYFICANLQDSLRGVLPFCQIKPFGSLVSGLGTYSSDLDMSLSFCADSREIIKEWNLKNGRNGSPFFYLSKNKYKNERVLHQNSVEFVSLLLDTVLPLYRDVICIPNARVPLVKCLHAGLNIQCDISLENALGRAMANLLFSWTEVDERFAQLVFTIRMWAKQTSITAIQSIGLSNFMIVLLVTHYLQVQSPPILPSVKQIVGRTDEDTFPNYVPQNVSRKFKSSNRESLDNLLKGFFHYYSKFDFNKYGISLTTGCSYELDKMNKYSMVIDNPTETFHNVCKNLRKEHVDYFVEKCQQACNLIESDDFSVKPKNNSSWGLLDIIGDLEEELNHFNPLISAHNEDINTVTSREALEPPIVFTGSANVNDRQYSNNENVLLENKHGILYSQGADQEELAGSIHNKKQIIMDSFYSEDDNVEDYKEQYVYSVGDTKTNTKVNQNTKSTLVSGNDHFKIL